MIIKQQFKVEAYLINGIYYSEQFEDYEPHEIYFKGSIGASIDNERTWKVQDLESLAKNLNTLIEAMKALETAENLSEGD